MYTNRLPRLDFQHQLMGRRDTGRPRRRWKEQDNSSFKGTGSRTCSLDTFVMMMVMEREKALWHAAHRVSWICRFLFYRLSEQYSVSRLVEFTRFRKYETARYDREFMKRELLMTSLTACGSWSAASQWDGDTTSSLVLSGQSDCEWLRVTVCPSNRQAEEVTL